MHFFETSSCMYYMLAWNTNKNNASEHLQIAFNNTNYAPPVPGQHHDTSQTSQPQVKEKPTSQAENHLHDSTYDSEGQDSAILVDNENDPTDLDPAFDKPYTVTNILGKGIGVIATRNIRRGERLLVEKPLLRHTLYFEDKDVIEKYNQLAEAEKDEISKLRNIRPSRPHRVLGIIWTNSIKISSKPEEYGLFITASRLNHACAPNTHHTWNSTLGATTVHASANIRKGEEITSSYLEGVASPAERGKVLARDFDFICDCAQCLLTGEERRQSDERLRRIWILEATLASALPPQRPANTSGCPGIGLYGDILELLSHYEKERISDCRPAMAYMYAWRLSRHNGYGLRAIESAQCALRIYSSLKGDDHPETIEWSAKLEAAGERVRRLPPSDESLPPRDDEERKA